MAVFVPDASLTLTWCFEDEASPQTDALLRRLKDGDRATVPAHWAAEITNGLLMAVRRKRISEEKAERMIRDLLSLAVEIDPENPLEAAGRVLALAQQHRLTAYDTAYLDLASRHPFGNTRPRICEEPPPLPVSS
jgi:predicted nucleic acid-binding protein